MLSVVRIRKNVVWKKIRQPLRQKTWCYIFLFYNTLRAIEIKIPNSFFKTHSFVFRNFFWCSMLPVIIRIISQIYLFRPDFLFRYFGNIWLFQNEPVAVVYLQVLPWHIIERTKLFYASSDATKMCKVKHATWRKTIRVGPGQTWIWYTLINQFCKAKSGKTRFHGTPTYYWLEHAFTTSTTQEAQKETVSFWLIFIEWILKICTATWYDNARHWNMMIV